MKKSKFIVGLILVLLLLVYPNDAFAATNCSKLNTKTKCNNKKSDGCTWGKTDSNNTKHCYTKQATCTKKQTKASCDKAGCLWSYNFNGVPSCKSEKSEVKSSTSNKDTLTKKELNFCASTAVVWQIVGWILLVFKIVVPLLLIILGFIDFSKAAVASKDDEIKKSMKKLLNRAIAAITIFFIPTIVGIIMGLVVDFTNSGAKADYEVCRTCVLSPNECDTSKDAGKK